MIALSDKRSLISPNASGLWFIIFEQQKATVVLPKNSMSHPGFPLYFGGEIQGLSRTLKLHFQGPILDGSLQHGQYYSNI